MLKIGNMWDLAEPEWAEDERNKANAESFSAEPAWLKEGKIHGDSTCEMPIM